jgi:hypothetical protein
VAKHEPVIGHDTPARAFGALRDVESEAASSSDHADPFQVRRRFWEVEMGIWDGPFPNDPTATQKVVLTQEMPESWSSSVPGTDSEAESSSDHADPFQVRRRFCCSKETDADM